MCGGKGCRENFSEGLHEIGLKWHQFPLCLQKRRSGGVKVGAKLKNWFRIQRLGFRLCGQDVERIRLSSPN